MHKMNLKRALYAERALDAFRAQVGFDAIGDTVTDLLSDMGHLCDAKELDFLALLAKAIGDWKLEQTDPESVGARPAVKIEVAS